MAKNVRALIARNKESFSFLYQETIDSFAQVRFFDPESEVPLFEDHTDDLSSRTDYSPASSVW